MITGKDKNRIDLIRILAARSKHSLQVLLNTNPPIDPYDQAIREAIQNFDDIWTVADTLIEY